LQAQSKNLYWLLLSILIIAIDQCSKYLAVKYLTFHQPVPLIPFFNLTLAHNTGAAFNFLGSAGGWQRWLFVGFAILVTVMCSLWLYRLPTKSRLNAAAISMVIGGAIGNVWDRLDYGYVIDFIDFYVNDWHWPIFNIADSAICIGVAILAYISFTTQDK